MTNTSAALTKKPGGEVQSSLTAPRIRQIIRPGFQMQMLFAGALVVAISIVGCELTSITVPHGGSLLTGLGCFAIVLPPLVLYLKEKGKWKWCDAGLTIFWALFFNVMLFYPVAIAARLGAINPLQDFRFIQADQYFHINVLRFQEWAATHWLGGVVNQSYPLLFLLMRISIVLPVISGRVKYAQEFLTSNLVAFALSLPLFTLLPAVGPWYGFHLDPRADEAGCQAALFLLRSAGNYTFSPPGGVICFPSFHVVWAILCARALWGFRWLRVPVGVLSGMIIFSTLTTGVHYFSDVLAGMLIAAISILAPGWLRRITFKDQDPGGLPARG